MERKKRNRVSLNMRIFRLVAPLSLVFMMLFGIFSYMIISSNAVSINPENTTGVLFAVIAVVIIASLLLALSVRYGTERLLSYSLKRLIADMQQICDEGKLSFAARKHKKEDPIGMLYEHYAKVIGVAVEFLSDIEDVSKKRKTGEAGTRINESKYIGAYFGAAQNVNTMMDLESHRSLLNVM